MAERTSPLRSGYDFEVVSPQLTPEDIHRETFGDESGGGLVREAVKGLRRYADARTTNDLATRALDAQLEGNTAQADELLQDRARRAAYSAPNAARVGRASDIGGAGDLVDWFGSTVGEGLPSMSPALLGAAVGRGALGRVLGSKTSAALGAAAPTYQDIHSSEVAGQFDDPVLAATPAEERARVARQTAALGTGLGVMLPARLTGGFSKGGRELLKDIAVESATEGGENLISQYGRRQLDPTREYDFVEAFDSAAAGAAVGAATGARVRTAQDAISSAKDAYANWSAGRGKPDGTPGGAPGGDPGGAPGGAPAAPSGLFDRVGESFSESGAVVREHAQSVAKFFDDAITDVVGPERAQAFRDRFNSAVGDVGGSISAMKDRLSEFADQEFGPEVADQIRATSEAMSKAGGDLSASASRFADAVKDRASEFDTTELRERMSTGVNKAKDAMSSGLDRMTEAMKTSKSPDEFLRKAFGSTIEEEAAADLDDNNLIGLRGATEAETAANIDRDDAARVERANRYARELMDDPATPDSVRERVASMQGDFSDPSNQKYLSRTLVAMRGGQKVAQAVADLVGLSKYALGAAKKAAGKAVSDVTDAVVKKKNLQSASPAEQAAFGKVIFDGLTDEAKANPLVRAQLAQVTNVVMAFAAKTGDVTAKDLPTLTKLANAMSLFKDPDAMAQQLVEYAGLPRTEDSFLSRVKRIQNARADIKQPNSFLYMSLTPEAMETFTGPMLQNLAQLVDEFSLQDAAGKGDEIIEGLSQAFGSPESARAVLDYYAQQNKADLRFDPNEMRDEHGDSPINEQDASALQPKYRAPNVNRPFLRGRDDAALRAAAGDGLTGTLREHVAAKKGNAKLTAFDIRRDLQRRLNENVSRDTESVRGALAALDAHLSDAPQSGEWAGMEDARKLRDKLRSTKTEDRSAVVKALRDELSAQDKAMEQAKRAGKDPHEALLDLYDVALTQADESKASDEQMTKFRELLDKGGKDPEKNKAIRKTAVTFPVDGKKVAVSLESMIYNSPEKGSIKERLLASLGLVAARADSMPDIKPDTIVKRNYYGKDQHLTWGALMGLNPKFTAKERKQNFKETAEDAARKAALDEVSASNLRGYLKSLPQDADALATSVKILGNVEKAQKELSVQMDRQPTKALGQQAQQLASKARVLKAFINETLDADYPIDRETILERLNAEQEETFDQGSDTAYKDILVAEAQMDALRDRADAVKGTKLAKQYEGRAEEIAEELDRDLSRLQPWQRMDEEDRPSGRKTPVDAAREAEYARRAKEDKALAEEDAQRPKTEPGTARQSTMKPKRGRPGGVDRQAQKTSQEKVVKNSFVGAKADPQGAEYAEKLLGTGTPADVVWRDLGWFRGLDGKLRKEVRSPVLRRRVRDFATAIANGSLGAAKVRDLLAGIDAFKPYIDKLGDMLVDPNDGMVELMGAIGAYNGEDGFSSKGIGISRVNAELAVRVEAVPGGKGTDLLREIADSMTLEFVETTDLIAELEARHPLPDINERVVELLTGTILHELQHAFQHIEGFENGGNATTAVISKYGDVDGYLAAIRDGDDDAVERITEQAFEKLRAEVGPDGDMEAAGHKLYESIVGEVEANDVAARMKLSDEEAASVKPALMDAERRFVRSVLLAEALSTLRSTVSSSKMKPKRGRPGKVDRQAVIDEIIRTRGKDVKVAVDKLHSALGGSGQYTYDRKTGRRLIEVAINAIDPIGTARHEAMHDFFQFLGENEATRAVARTLKEVMGSKEVMDKLKDLLQGHKDALEQLNDPEERVAYAYQFWAAGALDLGPKSTGIFRTITNFLRDMFGIVTKEQRALGILNAFHDGDFSNVSTVREALFDQAERDGATFWEKMDRMAPALNKAVLAMSSAAPDRLRRFENDSLNALADKFFTDGGKQGFIQNRFQQEGVWSNKLEAAFAGSTAEERRIALEQLQSMKPVSPLAKKLAEFNSEMYDYMSAAGVKTFDRAQKKWVPLRRVNNYFARSWDGDAIARNRSDFVQLLISEGGLSLGAAEKVTDKLINGREERLTPQEQSILGFTPYAVHTAERVFGFIKPGNADEFAKFQKKDIADIMSNYVQQAVYRAEYARSFDNDGRVISDLIAASGITDKDELTAISNTVQAMEGSLDPDKWSSSTKELMSVMMTAQNVILLPLAIVSQVVDPIVLAARTGDLRDAGTAYVNGIKRLWNTVSKNGNKVDGEDLAYILGIVSENSTLQAMGMTASTTRMSKRMEVINRKFFRYNGMQGWNNTMRITATAAAERYIIANKDNAEALAELGIAPGDVKMSTVYVPDGKGKLVAKHSLDVSSREVQQAMFKMVDQSVLRPSAANRPVWMSDPRFLLVGHLKQFTFAMHNVVLKRANKQLENGNAKPWLILALAAPAVLAADMAKFALTGGMPTSWGFFDYLSHAVNRSGLLGIGDFSTELFSGVGQGKLPGEGLLGPSFEHVAEILRWVGGDPRTDFEDVVDRTVPFAKYV